MKKDLTNLEVKTFDKVPFEVKKETKMNISSMRLEHPKLAELYDELNLCIFSRANSRSRDLQRLSEIQINSIRAAIKEYTKEHKITRENHLRWNRT